MRPDAGTARTSPLIVAVLVDRTDVIDEGVGRVVNRSTRAPPRQRLSTRWKDVVPDDDRPLPSARRGANCDSCRDHARLPPSPTRPSPRHPLPGIEFRSRREVAASFGSLCPATRPAPSRRLRPRSSRPPRHRSGPDTSDAQRLRRRSAAAMGRTRAPALLIGTLFTNRHAGVEQLSYRASRARPWGTSDGPRGRVVRRVPKSVSLVLWLLPAEGW
jgi:hypothetical protein